MFDPGLMRDFDDAPPDPCVPPFLSRFAKDGLRLDYLATRHGVGLGHPTFRTIEAAFALARPASLVIEGLPAERGISPEDFVAYALRHEAEGFAREGEIPFAALLAHRRGVPFRGGEPTDREAAAHLEAAGFSRREYVLFDAARWVPVWREQGTLEVAGLRARVKKTMGSVARLVGAEAPSYAEWESWCREAAGAEPSALEVSFGAPLRRGTPAQRLSYACSRARDARCLAVIGEELRSKGRVLVVYGCSHLAIQRPALEAVLGRSDDAKLF